MASRALRPTLVICLAAGIAAGIGLARPDLGPSGSTSAPAVADGATSPSADPYGRGGDGGGDGDGTANTVADVATITVSDFDFGDPIVVAPGTTVRVVNADGAPHTVTADDGEFDTGRIDGGETTTFVAPSEPGTYRFACGVHPSMTGSLEVEG